MTTRLAPEANSASPGHSWTMSPTLKSWAPTKVAVTVLPDRTSEPMATDFSVVVIRGVSAPVPVLRP